MAPTCGCDLVLDLFDRFYERVFAFARRSLDPASAEDIAQEVFVRLLHRDDLIDRTIKCSYLIRVADNLIKRRYRQAQRFEHAVHQSATRLHARPEPFPTEDEPIVSVGAQLHALSANEAVAVRMIVCDGRSYQETALAMGAKVSEVNNWRFRGIQRLRERVSGHDDGTQPQPVGRDTTRGGAVRRQRAG